MIQSIPNSGLMRYSRSFRRSLEGWTLTALTLAFAIAAFTSAAAQQPYSQSRRTDIASSARIYGYNLAEGNWTEDQLSCAALPSVSLIRMERVYSDGTESLFTALESRNSGRIHIVPVLYHGATPFLPAPRNPRNYALFNSLAPADSGTALTSRAWLDRSVCYAEMTGAYIDLRSSRSNYAEIAGEPAPTVHSNRRDHTASVTLAERDGSHSYRVWSVSFNRKGKIISAHTQEETVYAPEMARARGVATPENHAEPASAHESSLESLRPPSRKTSPTESATLPATVVSQPGSNVPPQQAATGANSPGNNPSAAIATAPESQPGWKPLANSAQPAAKFIPDAPQPPQKFIPNSADEGDQRTPQSQPQK